MPILLRTLFILFFLGSGGISFAEEIPFFHEDIARDAVAYDDYLQSDWNASGKTHEEWVIQGQSSLQTNDPRKATGAFASAVVLVSQDAEAWLGLARAFLAIEPKKPQESYSFPQNATSAAFLAYQRANANDLKAEALAVLAQALVKRSYWRPALDAYKSSLSISENQVIRTAYEELRSERGFRMLDYTVDSDAASPRVCVQFSEQLAKVPPDFSKFVTVDGKDPAGVSKEEQQLCIEGLVHGQRYEIAIRGGLPSVVNETLPKTVQLAIYVRDRKPSVRFSGRNYVLPRTGQNGIPVITVNTQQVAIEIYRIGDRNLTQAVIDGRFAKQVTGYDASKIKNELGSPAWKGEMPVESVLNEEVTTAFPIDQALPELKPGLYVLMGEPANKGSEYWQARATQWFVVSDLGLSAFTGQDGIHAFVRSLASAGVLPDVEVRLVARNNEVLATSRTDANGYVKFSSGMTKGEDGLAPALLVAQNGETDYAFLDLTRSSFDLTDRGVDGRQNPGPLDAYVFTERGVYRPSEDVYLTTLLRNRAGNAVKTLPLTIILTRPDGVEHRRVTLPDQGFGGRLVPIHLQTTAMTGTWRVQVYADPKGETIGGTSFLVEDYVPERLELKLSTEAKQISQTGGAQVRLKGRYLYGAPASNLSLDGEVVVSASKKGVEGFEDYHFGLADEQISPIRRPLLALPQTDSEGVANIDVALPALPDTTRVLDAKVILRLLEAGGRSIEETLEIPVKPQKTLIGLKPNFSDDHIGEGETVEVDVIALSPDGQTTVSSGLKWELLKVEQRFQWYSRNGAWDYEPVSFTERVANGHVSFDDGQPYRISAPVDYGRYRIEVTSDDPNGPAGSYTFSAGWFSTDAADTPDLLDLAVDEASYSVGDKAQVSVTPQTAGKALVAVVSDRLIEMKSIDVPASGATVEFIVNEDWSPGAYVTGLFYRPMDQSAKRLPGRSIGVKWLGVEQSARTLAIELDVPDKIRPNTTLNVPVKISGLKSGGEARVILAAVDVGILNLTNYQPPKPDHWFYGQRRLGTDIRDVYGRLIDGMQAVRGRIRSGGDGGLVNLQSKPPTQKPLALVSNIVEVGADGTATIEFEIPAFDGTARLMAVAWNDNQLGHAVKDLTIRDMIVLTGTTPRFMTAGDSSHLHLTIDNVEGVSNSFDVELTTEGGVEAALQSDAREISLGTGEKMALMIPMKAKTIGPAELKLVLTGENAFRVERSFDIHVQPVEPSITRRVVKSLPENGGRLTLSGDLFTDLLDETAKVTVNVGNTASMDVPGLLMSLDRYPYGCAEQITSRALPLLYLSSVANSVGLAGEKGARTRIQKAIDRLAELQDSSGSFGRWSPGGGDLWLTAYVTDFLTRARENNYSIRPRVFDQALDQLQNSVNYASDFKKGGEALAYALYVLARNGKAGLGDLRYYADTKLENFATPLAQAQLGAALSMFGDRARAKRAFDAAFESLSAEANTNLYRSDYGTVLRDGAATLTLVSETGVKHQQIPTLKQIIEEARLSHKRYSTTQENAWLLLAAHALINENQNIDLLVDGEAYAKELRKAYGAEDFQDKTLTVVNRGGSALTAAVTVTGAAVTPEPPMSNGFRIERQYYGLDGQQISPDKVKQNDKLVVVLKVEEMEAKGGQWMLTDRLPAGFEIENPRLVDGSNLKSLSWLKLNVQPEHTAFRDDRFEAAFNISHNRQNSKPTTITVAYVVRAVVPGRYMHPTAVIEDMYRPGRMARTQSGWTEVLAANNR